MLSSQHFSNGQKEGQKVEELTTLTEPALPVEEKPQAKKDMQMNAIKSRLL